PYGLSRRRIRITGPAGPVWVGCSCGSQYCMAPAAHPIDPHWQQHQITTPEDARWWWSARFGTSPNIVLVCGPPFHVWSMPRAIGARVLDMLPEKVAGAIPVAATPTGWWRLFCVPQATPEELPPVPAGFGVVHLGDGSAVTAPPSTRGALGHDMWLREPIPRQRLAPCSVIAPTLHRVAVQAGTARAHRRRGVHGVEPLQQAAG